MPGTPAVETKSTEKHPMPQKPVTAILKRPSASRQNQAHTPSSAIPDTKQSNDKPAPKKMTLSSFWKANTNGNSVSKYPSIGKYTPSPILTNPYTPNSITTNPFTSTTTSTNPYSDAGLPPKPATQVAKDPYSNAGLPPKPEWKWHYATPHQGVPGSKAAKWEWHYASS
jgi:hypothetical protein